MNGIATERPDDSGMFDDETLIDLIMELTEDLRDPIAKRDFRWIVAMVKRYRKALKEISDHSVDAPCVCNSHPSLNLRCYHRIAKDALS